LIFNVTHLRDWDKKSGLNVPDELSGDLVDGDSQLDAVAHAQDDASM
jgi:hypothetical protein